MADVKGFLLGADFLRANNIAVDLRGERLIDLDSFRIVEAPAAAASVPRLLAIECENSYFDTLLQHEFADLTRMDFRSSIAKHAVEHCIVTKGPPVFARPRRLCGSKLQVARAEFNALLELGIIRPYSIAWSLPLHLVKKNDGGWRPCGDFRLNLTATPYPIFKISLLLWWELKYSRNRTSYALTTKSPWQLRM